MDLGKPSCKRSERGRPSFDIPSASLEELRGLGFTWTCIVKMLRANVGIYRESQISSEKSNFGLYHPNNPLVWLFQKMILKNPQALCIWIILEKFENSQKNSIFILKHVIF